MHGLNPIVFLFSPTSAPCVPMSCAPPLLGKLGSFAGLGCLRRFRPSPVLVRFPRPPLISFLALSGFARSGPGVLVAVGVFSLFCCVPLLGARLSNRHVIFIVIFLPCPGQFHLHIISRAFIYPISTGCVCACEASEEM